MRKPRAFVVGAIALSVLAGAPARARGPQTSSPIPLAERTRSASGSAAAARVSTLWIFDADFSNTVGDNAGWTAYDRSGTVAQRNYWHHDTIRLTEAYLGESTWWCGTYSDCWHQPRGYANNWVQILKRSFSEVAAGSEPGDIVEFSYDQRYAMERNYDYGYVELSQDGGASWITLASYTNSGFMGSGRPHDWDHPADGHVTLDISAHAGQAIDLRFRFESDDLVSSQDQYDNPLHSLRDGAWQLDNLTINVNGSPIFCDDAESGNLGWIHDDCEASGQTGVTFWRGQYGVDFVTGQLFECHAPPIGTWMYAAVDPFTSTMINGQHSHLVSPPIDVSGAPRICARAHFWVDVPRATNDCFNVLLASSDSDTCVTKLFGFIDEDPGWWHYTSAWLNITDDWTAFAGNDWLACLWAVKNSDPPEEPHRAGLFLNRLRIGIPSGDPGTTWEPDDWREFNDWFQDDLAEALCDTSVITITDDDGIVSAHLMASNDNGHTWEAYEMLRESESSDRWLAPPPSNLMGPGSEILYYYEAIDSAGNASTYPHGAPARALEMSILPITASVTDPGILVVEDCGAAVPGARRHRVLQMDEFYEPSGDVGLYWAEILQALGYEHDVYDVEDYGGANGPDTSGMKYYDTQIWSTSFRNGSTLKPRDQFCLIQWLSESTEGKERNLLVTGNNIGEDLVAGAEETLAFYSTWLASEFVADAIGVVTVDSVPGLVDRAGGADFIMYDDGECILAGGCPRLRYFDVVDARAGVVGNEVVADYEKEDLSTLPAGVAYTHATMGYQTVNLGFGIEFIMDGTNPDNPGNYTPEGYYHNGNADRMELMRNIMEYFGKEPDGPGTGVAEGKLGSALSDARPNPFNPVTRIDYAVGEAGPVTIRIYDVAGRSVRTLLDAELDAGASGFVLWDGRSDAGVRCASGVYFYRVVMPGFSSSRKLVLLR